MEHKQSRDICQSEATALYSHADDVLHTEVVQWRHIRVVPFLVLQDDLLEDAVKELPVLRPAAASAVFV